MNPDLLRNVTDDTVRGLMLRMARNGQRAARKGDTVAVAKFEKAYDQYRAEAVRRGLISDDSALGGSFE